MELEEDMFPTTNNNGSGQGERGDRPGVVLDYDDLIKVGDDFLGQIRKSRSLVLNKSQLRPEERDALEAQFRNHLEDLQEVCSVPSSRYAC